MMGIVRQRARKWGQISLMAGIVVISAGFMPSDSEYFFKINKSIDIFGQVYKEITAKYVDEVDPEKFMQAGIDGMLETLDPYTVYIEKSEGDEVELMTSGRYGGIGVTIGSRDGQIQVITVMDGYSAQRQGILPGDRILEVGGVSVRGKKPDDVRSLTRGEPGTEVRVTVQREGEATPLQFVLIREEIQLKNVTYYELREGGIAYIRLERFSRKAGDDVRQAIKELKLKGDITGCVLDLRGNPGGLLDAAVDVVSKFVPKGSNVVSTRGRRPEADKTYLSKEEPVLPDVPLVVLTDRNSASASEIVSGAIQDLDRGLIIGTRTFGKGLVQTILPLNFGAQLKVTTARYYVPSGRSIQEIDYLHKNKEGVFAVTPDSLKKEFKTARGRTVLEHGGITPDSAVTLVDEGPMVRELLRKSMFFRFMNAYMGEHKGVQITEVNEEIMTSFKRYLDEQKFDYQEETEAKLKDLRGVAERSHYGKDMLAQFEILNAALEREKARGFERYKDHIQHQLAVEFMGRLKGERGRIGASLQGDAQLETAIALLRDKKLYQKRLKL